MRSELSAATKAEIVRMTRIIAGKVGYNLNDEGNASETLQQFSEEMTEYITDNIADFMDKGLEEKDAIIATQQKLSGEGFNKCMTEFFNKYGGAKEMQKPALSRNTTTRSFAKAGLPIVSMLYAAFILIGLGFGLLIGKIVGMVAIGIICGLLIGLGFGIVTHAVVEVEKKRQ